MATGVATPIGAARDFASARLKPLAAAMLPSLFGSRRPRIVLEPYGNISGWRRRLTTTGLFVLLMLFCLVYGFFFALTAPYLLVAFLVPPAVLGVLIIWALPDQRTAPTLALEYLFPIFLILALLWPDYLAITLPGLPWITLTRLTGLPMAALLLVCLSASKVFRHQVYLSVSSIKLLWIFFCGFVLVQFLTLPLSPTPAAALQMVVNVQVAWTAVFVISAILFRKTQYIERYWALLCCLLVPIAVMTILESREQHVLWAAHVPSFLRVHDETVDRMLSPIFRPGINLFRAKANFRTPLVLAEYVALLTPFFLHFAVTQKKLIVRLASLAMIPLAFYVIRLTDSRLGVAGMLVSVLLYGVLWSVSRWRNNPRDLVSAAIVFGYPLAFSAAVGVVLASHRLNMMVFGGGAQASSSAARNSQLAMALPKLWTHPFGHGTGQSGTAMGYAEGDFITVDNFFITMSMDYGIPGIIFWYGMFIIAIYVASRECLAKENVGRPEAILLAPLAVCLSAFLVIKWVHGQSDLHTIEYMMLGMVSALVFNLKRGRSRKGAQPEMPPIGASGMTGSPSFGSWR